MLPKQLPALSWDAAVVCLYVGQQGIQDSSVCTHVHRMSVVPTSKLEQVMESPGMRKLLAALIPCLFPQPQHPLVHLLLLSGQLQLSSPHPNIIL